MVLEGNYDLSYFLWQPGIFLNNILIAVSSLIWTGNDLTVSFRFNGSYNQCSSFSSSSKRQYELLDETLTKASRNSMKNKCMVVHS